LEAAGEPRNDGEARGDGEAAHRIAFGPVKPSFEQAGDKNE